MTSCPNCGHPNPEGSNFCSQCGSPLPQEQDQASQPVEHGEPQQGPSQETTRLTPATPEGQRGGTKLGPEEEAAVQALPAGSALLIVRRGENAGSRFLLDRETTTAGRRKEADIMLDDISVSRRHAVFTCTASGVTVKDVGSLNGTYVNRKLVDEQTLHSDDEVQIGKFRLVFYDRTS